MFCKKHFNLYIHSFLRKILIRLVVNTRTPNAACARIIDRRMPLARPYSSRAAIYGGSWRYGSSRKRKCSVDMYPCRCSWRSVVATLKVWRDT